MTETLRSPFEQKGTHEPLELAADIGNLALRAPETLVAMQLNEIASNPEARDSYMLSITEAALVENALWDKTHIDEMTGLLNKQAWQARLEQRIEKVPDSKGRVAMLMIDLDGFKRVNDVFGHAVGDEAIRRVGEFLRTNLRTSSTNKRSDFSGRQQESHVHDENEPRGSHETQTDRSHWGGDEYAITVELQAAGKDPQAPSRRVGKMPVERRLTAISARLEMGIATIADEMLQELLADPAFAEKAREVEILFGATIGAAVHTKKQTAAELFNVADKDLEDKKAAKKASKHEDPEVARAIDAAKKLLKSHGELR